MESQQRPIIVGIGELLWDIFPTGKKAGGAPVNFAYHAAVSGVKSYAISAVGDDDLGSEITTLMDGIGVNHCIAKVDYPTGTVVVELNRGVPTYSITQNVAWDYIPFGGDIATIARETNAVCFGTLAQRSEISRNTIREFLSQVPDEAYKILDINLRAPFYSFDLIEESLQQCNILKMNDEELEILKELYPLKGMNDKDACLWLMERYKLEYLILTAGASYSVVFSPESSSFMETPRIDVVDTVGAGDSFTAAFIASLLKGSTMAAAHERAVERAAAVCTVAGAWEK